MSFEYPIFQILLYIALFFAPPDTNRIFIGAGDGELRTLQRSGEAWEIQRIPHGDSPAIPEGRVFIEGGAVLLKKGDAWDPPFPMAEYVKLDRNHDWSRQPELRLPFGSVLAKTSDAVVLRVKDGTPGMKSYRIAYKPIEDGKRPTITVNVLGAVARPGAYTLGDDANVDELLLLAGGLVGGAGWDTMRILRGSADAPLKVVKGLRSPLLDRDTIYVPARGAQVDGGNGGRPEPGEIEAHLNRVSAMKHILASALAYADAHGGKWPEGFEPMREQLARTPLGGTDEDLARLGRLFEYRAPPTSAFGAPSPDVVAVLFELQPSSGVQFVGFADGHVSGFDGVERLREFGAPKPAGDRLSFRWVGEDGRAPAELLPLASGSRSARPGDEEKLSVFCEAVLTEADVESAGRVAHSNQEAVVEQVEVKLTEDGGRKFAAATATNIGRRLAIVFDGRVVGAPVVQAAITSGRLTISGRFTDAETKELLAALNRGGMENGPGIPSMMTMPPEARDLPALVPPIPPPETMNFGGVEWVAWRSLFEVRSEGLVSLPKVRPGFDYGHWGHGRGPQVTTNIGNPDWRDYRIDADLLVPGVDPAFNPHGLGLDFHGAMIAFHVVDMKESFNESGTSAYILGFEGPGNWSLTAQYNNYCRQPQGWGNNRSDGERKLASGTDVALDPVKGNRFRIEVRGDRIRVWIDGRKIVDLVDKQMGEPIGGRALDHGGVAFVGGFDAMIRLRSFEITHLGQGVEKPERTAEPVERKPWASVPALGPAPAETIRFCGFDWQPWRTLFEVRGDELVSLPKVRPGFDYGHWGHGRGPEVIMNIGNPDWRDYRVEADLLVPGVDPALNPHGLGLDFHGAIIAFHVAERKESFNESGTTGYFLGFEGPGNWSLTAQYNNYCRQPQGWGNNQSDGERKLASGTDVALDPVKGNRFRIELRGDRIRVWIDDRKIVDVVDAQMGEPIGGRTLDHGGVAFCGGFDAMIRLRNVSITPLGAAPTRGATRSRAAAR